MESARVGRAKGSTKPARVTLHRLGELSGRSRNTLLLRMRDGERLADATPAFQAACIEYAERNLETFLFEQPCLNPAVKLGLFGLVCRRPARAPQPTA